MSDWPALAYPSWRDTAATLQLWTQIVGKIRLSLTPWLNHGWQVPLYVTARGFGTSAIPVGHELLEMEFDLIDHRLLCRTSTGATGAVPLVPQTVAEFYRRVVATLESFGVTVAISTRPNEVADPIRFADDVVHASYDADAAHRFWRAAIQADRVFKLFRTGFIGKASPVHFFWGSFDLAVTRFSGRPAPLHPGGVPGLPDRVTREAYSHEVSSAGFWPGGDAFPEAIFYAYAYPEPAGFRDAPMPAGARFEAFLGEFALPYDFVRRAADPDALLLAFLDATYAAAADAGGWDRVGPGGTGVRARGGGAAAICQLEKKGWWDEAWAGRRIRRQGPPKPPRFDLSLVLINDGGSGGDGTSPPALLSGSPPRRHWYKRARIARAVEDP